jgi:nucleoside-diphosphate-sugar epimerase
MPATKQAIVAVTGATGLVGTATLERLLEANYKVRALTRSDKWRRAGVTWISGALDNPASLEELCDGADAVLHIAGVVNAPNAEAFEEGNVTGTANMLSAAKSAGVRRFVHVSSLSAREPKLSNYGASKMRAEKLVATSLLDWTIIRPPGVYGPGDRDILEVFKMAKHGFATLPPKGRGSWIHVDDLARLLVALLPAHDDATAQIFEADDGEPNGWDHATFARAIGWALGRRITTLSFPKPVLHFAAYGDRMVRGKNAKLTPDRAGYLSHSDWTIDRGAAPPKALWQPQIKTRQGLADTARWYKAQGWL